MRTLLFLPLATALYAQTAAEKVVSPEVHPDSRITFRIFAPKAESVTVNGDWMKLGSKEALAKGADGIWSATLGPLEPQVYLYSFNVDGMNIADPVNPRMKLRARSSASLVEVPGDAPWLMKDVPHGRVQMLTHSAKTLNGARREVFVYTPPGYEKGSAKYPVLYLFHGNNDVAAGWTWTGNAHWILDNMIAAGKAKPMVIVMPWGHAVPFGAAGNTEAFEKYLLGDVMPLVESGFRLSGERAIAGLSMGGGQALEIGLRHMNKFSSIGVFSSGMPQKFEERFADILNDSKSVNAKLKVFWIGIGTDDAALERNRALRSVLEKKGIRFTGVETPGGHFYPVWRRYLTDLTQLLFNSHK